MNMEKRRIKVYEIFLPHSLSKASNRVVQDAMGKWFVDPLLMGLQISSVLHMNDYEATYCTIDGESFADLEWLVANFKPSRTVFEVDRVVAATAYGQLYVGLAKLVRGSDSTAEFFIGGVPDVYSEH
ncbi:hypothetical protein [Marinobacter caseinilyticus]|uniref:hypothetical protein n=1 Tax=Marinobacter caseinilyticus TaxID=2692195 RepID=UPI00140AE0CB|nr:hypothetical protein [Marinobacter caseinilyticus]